ncbi:MAG: aminotransferase class I/II-fold pyridoxal phosphate-dependent enzyme [Rhodospirillales bacterium]|nr:aminotransferase class I/II-fold pyridoxal phosphate-dependent enzyme [Rhodospirillales bacterium]
MLNPQLQDLRDFPFDRLRSLLGPLQPPADLEPLMLSIGEPQHPPPDLVVDTLARCKDLWGKYPGIDGTPEFRQTIADWLTRRYGLAENAVKPDEHILPVAGTREALYLIGHTVIPKEKAGQRPVVLIPNPYYHVYSAVPRTMGALPVFVPATPESGFMPDFEALDEEILKRTALAYLCTPSNPQGAVADLEKLKRYVELARKYDFLLAADECYAEIYGDTPPPGALQACAELRDGFDNVIVFHSLSKRSSVPGLRSGFVAGPAGLIKNFRRLRSYAGATVPLPIIEVSTALWREEGHVAENRALYRSKFEAAQRLLGDRFGNVVPEGGFFLWLDVGDGEEAARRLWTEAAIRVLPGAYMAQADADGFDPGVAFIRIALVHNLMTTTEALQRIVKVL